MLRLLWLVPAFPFASALVLLLFGSRLSRRAAAAVGVGSIGCSALIAALLAFSFIGAPPDGGSYTQVLWSWISVAGFEPQIGLYLDALSLVMVVVVTFVGFLIHIYSAEFMIEDEGYSRFFGYMNLFVASMITLLLADNLLLLLLGWEGVGLCSYLLIGFWYRDPANGLAARKAFIVTRVGDTAMMLGLFLLFTQLGTLRIQDVMQRASQQWPVGSTYAVVAALLLLGGAVGKSAQLPLASVVAGCDGRTHPDQRTHPRGNDGYRGRVSDRAHARSVFAGARGAIRRCHCGCCHAACWPDSARLPSTTSNARSPTPPSARSVTCFSRWASAPGKRPCSTS